MTITILLAALLQDPGAALYQRAQKAHQKGELENAVRLYDACIGKGGASAANAAYFKAQCFEAMEPPRISDAQGAYGQVGGGDFGEVASQKLKYAGVDVFVARFAVAVQDWRETDGNNIDALEAIKKEAWEKIKGLGLGAKAEFGLVWALGHPDSLVRDFGAEKLPEIIDEEGLAYLLTEYQKDDPILIAGVGSATRRVMNVYAHAAGVDRQADEMERKLKMEATILPAAPESDDIPNVDKLREWAQKTVAAHEKLQSDAKAAIAELRRKADEIRKNIPKGSEGTLNQVYDSLKQLILNPQARVQARVEGVRISEELGELQGGIVNTLIDALKDDSSELRAEAARALGSIKKDAVADRQRASAELQRVVQHEPEKAADTGEEPDWRNNAFVRANAAFGISELGIVTATPSLIEALADNDARVRAAADRALRSLNQYEKIAFDADGTPDARAAGQKAWDDWWQGSLGVEVLIRRYRDFADQYAQFDTTLFYDPDFFRRRVNARLLILFPEDAARRAEVQQSAEESMRDFNAKKDIYKNEVVALGTAIVDRLLTFVGGEFEGVTQPHPSVRLFVAQCLSELGGGTNDKVRAVLIDSGKSAAKQIGAAFALGMLGSKAGTNEKEALAKQGLALDVEIKGASARALGMIGATGYASDLIGAASGLSTASEKEERTLIAICDALGRTKDASGDDLKALGELAGGADDGSKPASDSGLVREFASWALGETGNAAAWTYLIRARTDIYANVQIAARDAIRKLAGRDPSLIDRFKARAEYQLRRPQGESNSPSIERSGACLALGDAAPDARQVEAAEILHATLIGKSRREPKDPDPGVRGAAARAAGNLCENAGTPPEKAARALADAVDDDSQEVRAAAFEALGQVARKIGGKVPDVNGEVFDPKKDHMRGDARDRFNAWVTENDSRFRK